MYDNLLTSADYGEVPAWRLLDLTAEFATMDHKVLLDCLERRFRFLGLPLAWFSFYLTDRSLHVVHGESARQPSSFYAQCLGPILFLQYTAELHDLAASTGVSLHAFADDTQLYVHCKPLAAGNATVKLERCVEIIGC